MSDDPAMTTYPVDLHVERWGHGPTVLLVHGSVRNGEMTWQEQRPLASRWELVVLNRRGYFPNPPAEGEDFETDAGDVATLLGDGAHLVGHSYGGLVALLAAARRPEAVWSLTVTEPPAFGLVRGNPDVEQFVSRFGDLQTNGPRDPEAFLRVFIGEAGSNVSLPHPLPEPLVQHARVLMGSRPPWQAEVPVATLRAATFPKLVVSGGHDKAFDAVCDVLTQELDAERAVLTGAGHSVPQTGAPFNERLEKVLRSV